VTSNFSWTSYRFGYGYDFLSRPTWAATLIVDIRQTDITEQLVNGSQVQARRSQVPVPSLGAAARVTLTPRLSLSGEFTGFGVPDNAKKTYGGYIFDGQALVTFLVVPHAGAQAGYRAIAVHHLGDSDTAEMTLRGFYVGGVFRR
jgi:hypothetical protein